MAMNQTEKQAFEAAVADATETIVKQAMADFDADGIAALADAETAHNEAVAAEAAMRSALVNALCAATDDGKALRLQYIGDDAMRDAIETAIAADPANGWMTAFGYGAAFMSAVDASGGDGFATVAKAKTDAAATLKGITDTSADKLRFVPAVLTALSERAVSIMEIAPETTGTFTLTIGNDGTIEVVAGGSVSGRAGSAQPPVGSPDKIAWRFVGQPEGETHAETRENTSAAKDRILKVLKATGMVRHAVANVTSNPGRADLHQTSVFTQVYPLAYQLFPENTMLDKALEMLEIWGRGGDGFANTLTVYEYIAENKNPETGNVVEVECLIPAEKTEKGYKQGKRTSARFVQVTGYKVDADGTRHPDETKPALRFAPGGCLYSSKPLANLQGTA